MQADSADEICRKIREGSEYEVKDILERARREAEKILGEAKKEADKRQEVVLRDLEKERERTKERILSSLNLEKKRVVLQEKNRFAENVLQAVADEAANARNSGDYATFLKKAILEGAGVIDGDEIDVLFSFLDEKAMRDNFRKEAESLCRAKYDRSLSLTFHTKDFKDIGVIVQSRDGGMAYDNTFRSRLRRFYEDVHRELIKEAF